MIELNHKRIVVTFLMHLGDLVLTTPFLEVLRKAAPDSHITYVVDKKLADVVRYNPHIDELVEVDKKGEDNSIGGLNRVAKSIQEKGPIDVVINLHPNERTSYLAWRLAGKATVGMSHFLFRPFMTQYTRLNRRELHAADMYIDVLYQLGVPKTDNHGLAIYTSPAWDEEAKNFYASQGIDESAKLIGFNVGSAVPEKRWPKERFAAVADSVAEEGYVPVFFGGPMDEEMVADVVAHMSHQPIVATGQFALGPLASAIRCCQAFVTNDSGPMHVAVSQKVPVLALYGPSNPKFYGPYTDKAIVLESMDHYEIGKSMKKVLKEGKYKGLSVITLDQVIRALHTLLEGK